MLKTGHIFSQKFSGFVCLFRQFIRCFRKIKGIGSVQSEGSHGVDINVIWPYGIEKNLVICVGENTLLEDNIIPSTEIAIKIDRYGVWIIRTLRHGRLRHAEKFCYLLVVCGIAPNNR